MKQTTTVAAWRVIDKDGDVITFGIESYPCEFDLDILPGGWGGDRNIDQVQKATNHVPIWEDNGYKFEYKLYELADDLTIKEDVE